MNRIWKNQRANAEFLAQIDREKTTDGLSFATQLMGLSRRVRARPWVAVAVGVASWAVALVARAATDPYLPPGFPFLTFFPAVVVCGLLGGLGCGVLCATLSGLSAWYFFIPPFNSFMLSSTGVVAMGFYVFVVAVDLALIHFLYQALDVMSRDQTRLRRSLDQQRTLFAELQHRVANNLAFVSALFGIQRRRLAGNAAAVAAFDDARMRLDTIGNLHRRLYDPANADRPLDVVMRETLSEMLAGAGRADVRLSFDCAALALPLDHVMTLSLFVVEAATNAVKHAFSGREGGELRISVVPAGEGRARLTIADDGPGWPEGGPSGDSPSLGLRILKSFAAAVGGTLTFETRAGAVIHLDFPVGSDDDARDART